MNYLTIWTFNTFDMRTKRNLIKPIPWYLTVILGIIIILGIFVCKSLNIEVRASWILILVLPHIIQMVGIIITQKKRKDGIHPRQAARKSQSPSE
jgi:hypothetical protein